MEKRPEVAQLFDRADECKSPVMLRGKRLSRPPGN
jgi:hypothetical protein